MTRRRKDTTGLPPPPAPDYSDLLSLRLHRLLDWLERYLKDDHDLLVCFPLAGGDPLATARYIEQIAGERESRAHLNDRWIGHDAPPAGVSLPLSIGQALALARGEVPAMAQVMADQVRLGVELFVSADLRPSVLARDRIIVPRWPRLHGEHSPGPFALHCLTAVVMDLPEGEQLPDRVSLPGEDGQALLTVYWPPDAALLDVARWVRAAANREVPGLGDAMVSQAERSSTVDFRRGEQWVPLGGIAALYLAEKDVKDGLKRQVKHISATADHHALVDNWSAVPGRGPHHRPAKPAPKARVDRQTGQFAMELLLPGRATQLRLPLRDTTIQEGMIDAVREVLGAEGLRHYAAWMRLLAIEGGRRGYVRYTVDDHLTALGYDERRQRDPEVRAKAVRMMRTFCRLEVAIYDSNGLLRYRRPLVHVGGELDRKVGDEWQLEGMELRPNDLTYGGVLKDATEWGRNFMPAPIEIAQVSHERYPHFHGMAILLAIRCRWALGDGHDYVDMTGRKWMDVAKIVRQAANPGRAWQQLQRHLDKLVDVGLFARYEWKDAAEAWSDTGVCRAWIGEWLVDRTSRQLTTEAPPPPPADKPITGAELRVFRLSRAWSQRQAAAELGVSQGAIYNAEAHPEKPLGHKLRAAFSTAAKTD